MAEPTTLNRERFGEKLAEFSKALTDSERALLKHMLDRGDTMHKVTAAEKAARDLRADYFNRLCW
jgi:hypothetical protein